MCTVRNIILLSLFSFHFSLLASQNEAFRSGNGDGYAGDLVLNIAGHVVSLGGNGDGYDSNQYMNNQHTLSLGGYGDGYAKNSFLNSKIIISHGGIRRWLFY